MGVGVDVDVGVGVEVGVEVCSPLSALAAAWPVMPSSDAIVFGVSISGVATS